MMTLQELSDYLDQVLTPDLFSDYCPNGIQVEGRATVQRVATAVTASEETIKQAVDAEVDALIVHHGLFWKGDPYPVVGAKARKLSLLLKSGLSLLAYHLPLDAHRELGNNWRAARELGWRELQPFGVLNGVALGVMGTFSAVPVGLFQKQLEQYYDHPAHAALGGPDEVGSAALISGGAYRQIPDAARAEVDCFITGNFDEPAWHLAREERVNFFAMGHAATERVGPQALGRHIEERLALECVYLRDNNPF